MPASEPFLPYGRQTIIEEDIAAVEQVLRSPYLTQGPAVPAFEQAVAAQVAVSHSLAVNSATSALHLACLALGLKPGDRLWTSPITFVASANCARYCGADVDFVDIDPATGLISITALAAKLEQSRAKCVAEGGSASASLWYQLRYGVNCCFGRSLRLFRVGGRQPCNRW